jgi:hypothetical protein
MAPRIPLPGPHDEDPIRYLELYGFERQQARKTQSFWTLASAVVAVAMATGYLLHGTSLHGEPVSGTEIALFALTFGAFLLGGKQWREAREENSMDRYYERLDTANRRRECAPESVHTMMKNSIPALAGEDPQVLMYVYVELDNLEYVAGKYRLGYMRPGQTLRGLRTFQRRCLSPKFRQIALTRIREGGDYHRYTAAIVERVCDAVTREEARERPAAPGMAVAAG